MKIVKHSGNIVDFNRDKLKSSLLKSGANKHVVEDILQEIDKQIYEGISTKKIYKLAFGLLKKVSNSNAARYNLRTAIQMLGPAGFFFEKSQRRVTCFIFFLWKKIKAKGDCCAFLHTPKAIALQNPFGFAKQMGPGRVFFALLFFPFLERTGREIIFKIYYYDKKFQMAFIGFPNLYSL